MKIQRKVVIIFAILLWINTTLSADTDPVRSALDSIAKTHYSVHLQTVVGNFTWNNTGLGTGYSNILRKMVEEGCLR